MLEEWSLWSEEWQCGVGQLVQKWLKSWLCLLLILQFGCFAWEWEQDEARTSHELEHGERASGLTTLRRADRSGRPNQQLLRNRAARPIHTCTRSLTQSVVSSELRCLRLASGKCSCSNRYPSFAGWAKYQLRIMTAPWTCSELKLCCLSVCGSDVGRGFYFHFWKKHETTSTNPTVLCQWDLNEDSKWCALKLACHFYVVCPQATVSPIQGCRQVGTWRCWSTPNFWHFYWKEIAHSAQHAIAYDVGQRWKLAPPN